MPRKRYIKPGFFKNEELAALKPLVRIFFQGLWCWADREGRLENRPARLKAEIMPYDKFNVATALNSLQSAGFIQIYTSTVTHREINCIQIKNFKEHQDCHINEPQSILPEYKEVTEKKHGANIVQEPDKHGANTPYTLTNTYTLNLEEVVVVDNAQARKNEIEQAIEDYCNEPDKNSNATFPEQTHLGEKEKNSAQKEKEFPSLEVARDKIINTASWRNILQHHQVTEDDREVLFKLFYEQKEDAYRIRYPTANDMASHFYFWIGSRKKLELLKPQLGITNDNTTNKINGNNFRKRTEDTRAELAALSAKSSEFLRKSAG